MNESREDRKRPKGGPTRPRHRLAYVGYAEPLCGVSMERGRVYVHLPSGERVPADALTSETQYTSETGKTRVVNRVSDAFGLDPMPLVAAQYDLLYAVDTNTKPSGLRYSGCVP